MIIENELDAYLGGFHLDALSSAVPLNVDLDTTLTVLAGNLYRLLARQLPRYALATPDTIWRHFLDTGGTLREVSLHSRSGAFPEPADNAITAATLQHYNSPRVDPNVALLAVRMTAEEAARVLSESALQLCGAVAT